MFSFLSINMDKCCFQKVRLPLAKRLVRIHGRGRRDSRRLSHHGRGRRHERRLRRYEDRRRGGGPEDGRRRRHDRPGHRHGDDGHRRRRGRLHRGRPRGQQVRRTAGAGPDGVLVGHEALLAVDLLDLVVERDLSPEGGSLVKFGGFRFGFGSYFVRRAF